MIDEGYTKFVVDWTRTPSLTHLKLAELIQWRNPLYAAGLIGEYEEQGIGFGNISVRSSAEGQFIISGTQTGHLAVLENEHFSLVTDFDLTRNSVTCSGPIQASSESMTHATLYSLDASISAVVHVHSAEMWLRLGDSLPATNAAVAYGTPEMAVEFERLYRETEFPDTGVAIMAGHEDGLISIGKNMQEAANRVLELVSS
jgi:ribulose-5-phosphate 4-epimerase/fuculose-1-phosphate aldolase